MAHQSLLDSSPTPMVSATAIPSPQTSRSAPDGNPTDKKEGECQALSLIQVAGDAGTRESQIRRT